VHRSIGILPGLSSNTAQVGAPHHNNNICC
jgi:hypothetical protein